MRVRAKKVVLHSIRQEEHEHECPKMNSKA